MPRPMVGTQPNGVVESTSHAATMHTVLDQSVGYLLETALSDAVAYLLSYAQEHRKENDLLEIERVNILAAMDWSAESQAWRCVIDFQTAIGSPVRGFLGKHGYWNDVVRCCQLAILAAEHVGDRVRAARYNTNLGVAHQRLGQFSEAKHHYDVALNLFTDLGDENSLMVVLHQLGNHARATKQLDEAQRYYERSLAISQRLQMRPQIAATLYQLANISFDREDDATAKCYCLQSLEIARETDDSRLIGHILIGLGDVSIVESDFEHAREYLAESYQIAQQLDDRLLVAHIILDQASLEEHAENYQQALELSRQALTILKQLGSPVVERAERLWARVWERSNLESRPE